MGLIQNVIEGMGVSTVSITVHPHLTAGVGVPRAITLRFPQGNVVGEPFNEEQQLAILANALHAVETIQRPNTILEWPYRWRARPQETR